MQHVDLAVVQCVVVAGPGFLKSEFLKWLREHADSSTAGGGSSSSSSSKAGAKEGDAKSKDGKAKDDKDKVELTRQIVDERFFEASCATANKEGL